MKVASIESVRGQFDQAHPMHIRKPTVDTIDPGHKINETVEMTDSVSRYELDAKLETIEARMDARVARIEESNIRIEAGMSSLKTTMIVTAISSAIAVIAANIGIVQTMYAAFESGKSTATAITQASEDLKQTRERLDSITTRLDAREKAQK